MKPVLEIENIWKQYAIGGKKEDYLNLREALKFNFKRKTKEKFWALQDVSFQVLEGECLGIIGRNGAGKSTLLKILSRITPPTKGTITARGRVASLLEVGTGFHPELTGRENVYLNGATLGLTKREIDQKFDEIVAFSGVEKFLNTPLKHFSSGMKLRLAFSVAAHLEPEILLIDEVLAVGDTEFQKKCIGRMDEVSKQGRTIIFVSHDLEAVRKLCTKGIILDKGIIKEQGESYDIVNSYLKSFAETTNTSLEKMRGQLILNMFTIKHFAFKLQNRALILHFQLEGKDFSMINSLAINIFSVAGKRTSLVDLRQELFKVIKNKDGKSLEIISSIDLVRYVEGIYFFSIWIGIKNGNAYESERIGFELISSEINNKYPAKHRGYFEIEATNELKLD